VSDQIYTSPFQGYDAGVQGLSQLGRNAIERVTQLERALAERDETIRQLRAQLDEYERAPTFTYSPLRVGRSASIKT